MKKITVCLFFLFTFFLSGISQEIKIKKSTYKFGFVTEGDTVHITYEIKNIGNAPLVISNYEVECGCTVVEKPMVAIEVGETYLLKVTFDSHNKYDRQDRTIKLVSNAINAPTILRFKGVVLPPKKGK